MSNRVQYCGIALIGFDAAFYPDDDVKAITAQIVSSARTELETWKSTIGERLKAEALSQFEIELFCFHFRRLKLPFCFPQGDGNVVAS